MLGNTLEWAQILGHPLKDDFYGASGVKGNFLIVGYNTNNSHCDPPLNGKVNDVEFAIIRLETGEGTINDCHFALASASGYVKLMDMIVSDGIYLLAQAGLGNLSYIQNSVNYTFTTNSTAILLFALNETIDPKLPTLDLYSIEAYPNPHSVMIYPPTRFYPYYPTGVNLYGIPEILLAAHLDEQNKNGLIFYSYQLETCNSTSTFRSSKNPFATSNINAALSGIGCIRSFYSQPNKCAQCDSGNAYYLTKSFSCNSATCPGNSYLSQGICKFCHSSCLTCSGPLKTQCLTCDPPRTFNSFSSECSCPSFTVNGACSASCNSGQAGYMPSTKICKDICPPYTFPYVDFINPNVAPERAGAMGLGGGTGLLQLSPGASCITLPGPTGATALPSQFTTSFWFFPNSFAFDPTVILWGFNTFSISAGAQASFSILNSMNTPTSLPSSATSALTVGIWNYIAISVQKLGNTLNLLLYVSTAGSVIGTTRLTTTSFNYPMYVNQIMIGCNGYLDSSTGLITISQGVQFTGSYRELLFEKIYNEAPSLEDNKNRVYGPTLQIYKQILAYWRFDQIYAAGSNYQIVDSSQYQLTSTFPMSASLSISNTTAISTSQWDNLAQCEDFFLNEFPKYSVNPQYYIATSLLERIKGFNLNVVSFLIGSLDTISLNKGGCAGPFIQKVTITNNAGYLSVSEGATIVPQSYGLYLDICFYSFTFAMTLNLGQVHFVDIPNHIFPSNKASDIQTPSSLITFQLQGGDQSLGDIIKLQKIEEHALSNSQDYIFVDEEEPLFVNYRITKTDDTTFTSLLVGNLDNSTYTLLWRPSFLTYQVNRTNEYKNLFSTWKIQSTPLAVFPLFHGLAGVLDNAFLFKGKAIYLNLDGPGQMDGDQVIFCYTGCNYMYKKGPIYTRINGNYPMIWLGEEFGISNLLEHPEYDRVYICWRPYSRATTINPSDDMWNTVLLSQATPTTSFLRINWGVDYTNLPEIAAINPPINNPVLRSGDSIWFQLSKCTLLQMMPSSYIDGSGNSHNGTVQLVHVVYTAVDHSTYSTEVIWEQNFTRLPSIQSGVFAVEKLIVDPAICNYTLTELDLSQFIPGDTYMLIIYSLSFKSLTQGIYLFGQLDPRIAQFQYQFTFEEANFQTSQQLIFPDQTEIEIKGTNFGDIATTINGVSQLKKLFSVDISLTCNNVSIPASYSVLSYQNMNPTSLTLTNLDLSNCNSQLVANITLYKLISDNTYTMWSIINSRSNFQIGIVGCSASCQTCDGNTSYNCTTCYSNATINYLYNGQCVSACGSDIPFPNPIFDSSNQLLYYKCTISCPSGTFYDTVAKICKVCNGDCRTCTSDLGRSCSSCLATPIAIGTSDFINVYSEMYFFEQMCLLSCPTLNYDYYSPPNNMVYADIFYHICRINTMPKGKSPISVQIQPIAYSRKLDVKTSLRLRALVQDPTSSMIRIAWFAHPNEDVNNLTFTTQNQTRVFQSYLSENINKTVTSVNMNTFNYKKTIVIVKAYTNDSFAFDSIELQGNSAPDLNVSFPTIPSSDGGTVLNTLSPINITVNISSSQSGNDTYQTYKFGVFLKVKSLVIPYGSATLGLMGCPLTATLTVIAALPGDVITLHAMEVMNPINSVVNIQNVYMPALIDGPQELAECTNQSTPILMATQVAAELWVICEDRFQSVTIQKTAVNLTEKYMPTSRNQTINDIYTEIINSEAKNNYSLSLVFKIANIFKAILPDPPQPFMQFVSCTRDIQCGYGTCMSSGGYSQCLCRKGYAGDHCDWSSSELKKLQAISYSIFNFLNTTVSTPLLDSFSRIPGYLIEDSYLPSEIANILIGLLHNPEVGNSSLIIPVIQLCSCLSKFSMRVSFRLTDDQKNNILKAVDISLLFVLYKIRNAIFPYFVLNEANSNITSAKNADFYALRETLASYILPVRDSLYQIANTLSASQFFGDAAFYKKYTTFELFLNSENAEDMQKTRYGHFAIQSTLTSGFVKFPENLINTTPSLLASNSEFVIRLIKWIESPYLFSEYLSEFHTSIQSASILNSNGTELAINLTSPLIYFLPVSNFTKNYPFDRVICKIFNETNVANALRAISTPVDVNQLNLSESEKKKEFPEWNPLVITTNLIANQTKLYTEKTNFPEFIDANGVASYGRKYGTSDYDQYVPCASYTFGEIAGIIQRRASSDAGAPISGFYYYFSPWSVWASSLGFYSCCFLLGLFIVCYTLVSILDCIMIPRLEKIIEIHRLENSEKESDVHTNLKDFDQIMGQPTSLNIKKVNDDDAEHEDEPEKEDEDIDYDEEKKDQTAEWKKKRAERLSRRKKKNKMDDSSQEKRMGDSTVEKFNGTSMDLNESKTPKEIWKPSEPITTAQNVTQEMTTSGIMKTGNTPLEGDGNTSKIYNDAHGSEIRRKARVNTTIEDIFTEEHKEKREEMSLTLKNVLIHGNLVGNLIVRTSTTFYRNVRCIMVFEYIYFHMFWAAVLLGTTCDPLGWPEKYKHVYDMVVEKVWIPILTPVFTTFMNYMIPLVYKVDDKRVLDTRTYNQYIKLQ